jgi:hypothetical protein
VPYLPSLSSRAPCPSQHRTSRFRYRFQAEEQLFFGPESSKLGADTEGLVIGRKDKAMRAIGWPEELRKMVDARIFKNNHADDFKSQHTPRMTLVRVHHDLNRLLLNGRSFHNLHADVVAVRFTDFRCQCSSEFHLSRERSRSTSANGFLRVWHIQTRVKFE